MAFNEIPLILSILAAMISIPFAASTIDYINEAPGLAVILNTTPEFISNSSIPSMISKTITDDGILYLYRTPYGEYTILISPEKFEQTLLKIGKRVSTTQKSTEQFWELSLPSESLKINHSEQKVVETYRIINGYLKLTTENGYTKTEKSGTATQEELKAGMENLEKELNQTINHMKEMSEQILNVTKEEVTTQTTGNVVINEFVSDVNTSAGETEWIEIYNPTDTNISLTNWRIEDNVGTIKTLSGVINSNDYIVVNVSGLNNAGDIIKLRSDVGLVDSVTYGNWNDGNVADNAPKPLSGESTGRRPNGVDTNMDSVDFIIYTTPTPDAANP